MLRFIVDESTGRTVTQVLRGAGCDALDVSETMPHADDAAILLRAAKEDRIVVTNDKDFGDLVFRSGMGQAGVVLFRLSDETAANRMKMAKLVVELHGNRLPGCFTVVTERTIRIRPMK